MTAGDRVASQERGRHPLAGTRPPTRKAIPVASKVEQGNEASKTATVVPIRPRPRRLSLERARAAAMSPAPAFVPRRAGESDEANTLRTRHYLATMFVRALATELEAQRPIAEASLSRAHAADVDSTELERLLACIESVRKAQSGSSDQPRIITAVRDALERARKWNARHREQVLEGAWGAMSLDVDDISEKAMRSAPELAMIPRAAWADAIERWPGLDSARGGSRKKGEKKVTWYRVVFDLLHLHGLSGDAPSAESLKKTFDSGGKKRSRPSRAK